MSDDEPDHELLELLRQHMQGKLTLNQEPETGVLESAEWVYDNSIDVALDMRSCKNAAAAIYAQMQEKQYSPATWSSHELHPDRWELGDEETVAFVFTMDLLNFSFWSERKDEDRFAVEYAGKRWTGYWSLVAALRRALDESRLWLFFVLPRESLMAAFHTDGYGLATMGLIVGCVEYYSVNKLNKDLIFLSKRHSHHRPPLLAK